ncbi:hypothetical protein [Mucilaginibacter pedocola]|uniref:Uncharacterized protein n=1 Tax=Mucilaginibacter pedocola TaxID=1792845 RepID=A0A1S9PK58_9SPHI|nr:hypothetical protein [Mucilaginibacter pedocola]OOQ61327.1 hypothetical protein BC343_20310 [Mucilaginibacter pedocola]
MDKKEKYVDIGILVLLGLFIAIALNNFFRADLIISVNTYAGIGFWTAVLFLNIIGNKKSKYLLFIALFLYMLNIIDFSATRLSVSLNYNTGKVIYHPISFNPVGAILFIVYWIYNKNVIRKIYTPTVEEDEAKLSKNLEFYKNKFSQCSKEELTELYKNYRSYPVEAQVVLDKLIKED